MIGQVGAGRLAWQRHSVGLREVGVEREAQREGIDPAAECVERGLVGGRVAARS